MSIKPRAAGMRGAFRVIQFFLVRSFTCDVCGQLVFFENSVCVNCHTPLGYSPTAQRIVPLSGDDGALVYAAGGRPLERQCANLNVSACNWLVGPDAPGGLCLNCALTRTRPNDNDVEGMKNFRLTEIAKRRLVYQLLDLGLPVVRLQDDPAHGLAFDLLSSENEPVTTGHADGVVTLDLAEGDDPHREALRVQLAEPYRTLLGHLRHETGHYYWEVLVTAEDDNPATKEFRELFGDDRASYSDALDRHYNEGAPANWPENYVSAYATMHPWEDWAETFAHYLHILDTLQTAGDFGIVVSGPRAAEGEPQKEELSADPSELSDDQTDDGLDEIIATWLPLTYALNAVNRSMGHDDLYPFVLSPKVIEKLRYVHRRVREAAHKGAGV